MKIHVGLVSRGGLSKSSEPSYILKKYINIPQLIKTHKKKNEFPVLDCDGVCYVFIAVIIRVEILDDIRYY